MRHVTNEELQAIAAEVCDMDTDEIRGVNMKNDEICTALYYYERGWIDCFLHTHALSGTLPPESFNDVDVTSLDDVISGFVSGDIKTWAAQSKAFGRLSEDIAEYYAFSRLALAAGGAK